MKTLCPADYVIYVLGGPKATGLAIGRTRQAVSLWRIPKKKGGTGGRIPPKCQVLLLKYAYENAIDIKPEDFTYGRRIDIPKVPIWEQR